MMLNQLFWLVFGEEKEKLIHKEEVQPINDYDLYAKLLNLIIKKYY